MDALSLVFKYEGAVFGGYVRDTIAGLVPNDIDAVVPEVHQEAFEQELLALGYSFDGQHGDHRDFSKEGLLPIEVIYGEDPPASQLGYQFHIGPTSVPDFSVNLLAYDGVKLYNWAGVTNGNLNVLSICAQIARRETLQFRDASGDRVRKMNLKPFTIVDLVQMSY